LRPVVLALVLALAAGLTVAACDRRGNSTGPSAADTPAAVAAIGTAGTPGAVVTPTKRLILPTEYICDSAEIAELGLGLRVMQNQADAVKLLRGVMPFPDPATLPRDMKFQQGYINSIMSGQFKQSTLSLVWIRGDGDFAIHYMNAYPPLDEPPKEAHEPITIRDGKSAYLFQPPFKEGLHSILWREGCRYISVIGSATKDEVLAVAENLMLPEDTPPDATLGDLPDVLATEIALPTMVFRKGATPVPGMTGTPVFGPDEPGWIPPPADPASP
jgi:hypothetical protein